MGHVLIFSFYKVLMQLTEKSKLHQASNNYMITLLLKTLRCLDASSHYQTAKLQKLQLIIFKS